MTPLPPLHSLAINFHFSLLYSKLNPISLPYCKALLWSCLHLSNRSPEWSLPCCSLTSVMNGCFCDRTNTISSSPYFPGSLLCVFQSLMTSCLWLVENLASGSFFFLLQCLALNRLGVYLLPPELGMRANYLSHQRSPFCAQNTL